jgi:hypothetical protein
MILSRDVTLTSYSVYLPSPKYYRVNARFFQFLQLPLPLTKVVVVVEEEVEVDLSAYSRERHRIFHCHSNR